MPIHRLIVSAPTGQRVRVPGTTPTIGPYIGAPKLPRFHRLHSLLARRNYYSIRSRRVSLEAGAWPACELWDWCTAQPRVKDSLHGAIVDVYGHSPYEWQRAIDVACGFGPAAVELLFPHGLPGSSEHVLTFAVGVCKSLSVPLIIKLPAFGFMTTVAKATSLGCFSFHCSCPLPVHGGGLIGSPLKEMNLRAVADISAFLHARDYPAGVLIGSGVESIATARHYFNCGATHVSVDGPHWWNWPLYRRRIAKLARQIAALDHTPPPRPGALLVKDVEQL